MEQLADKVSQEYWRPAVQNHAREVPVDVRSRVEVCEACGTEFVLGARFCHVCGGERQAVQAHSNRWAEALDFDNIRHALGLSTGALISFIVGIVCLAAAIATGFIYSAKSLVDWQAVQVWRIEWLLAAAVAFIAGILLKRNEA
ncbi:MAG TPA: hypothetical protein VN577_15400 [Terriglobales bacterium]|nr:hypothetical protein [Terriglobales bacterium]